MFIIKKKRIYIEPLHIQPVKEDVSNHALKSNSQCEIGQETEIAFGTQDKAKGGLQINDRPYYGNRIN